MRKIKSFLLACLMVVSILTLSLSAAEPTVQPLWDNTSDVIMAHDAVGTTAHCYVDITLYPGSTMENAVVRLIAMDENPQTIVKTWDDPEFTLGINNMYSFYETFSGIVPGNTYRLVFQCEVWRNGTCDYISLGLNAIY